MKVAERQWSWFRSGGECAEGMRNAREEHKGGCGAFKACSKMKIGK
jgi:hypothetical protein